MMSCCASCGKAEGDDVKLKKCGGCGQVKYCSVACQKNHRLQHKKACKKRAAEIRDDELFTQPDGTHFGECPICCLPLPLGNLHCSPSSIDMSKTSIRFCCSKLICLGCDHANVLREREQGLGPKCPFCREPMPENEEESQKRLMKRAKANDTVAICEMGKKRREEGDYEGAFEYYTMAAELGYSDAHYELSVMYQKGKGVEKDPKKEVYHLKEAAIGGHPSARFNLGCEEGRNGRIDRAMKHHIIGAKLGDDNSLEAVKKVFQMGLVSKEDYEVALRGHQAAVDATKSKQREEAYKFWQS